ncbi:MAG TPA: hypothetical protein VFJ62_11560 [Usitatibacter sp.]|nr:hypothetical protein [Usitatibacter sp.]
MQISTQRLEAVDGRSDVKTNNMDMVVGTREAVPLIHRLISVGFALCVLASAAVPALGLSI